ncbi:MULTISPECIES: amidohydrolase [Pseudoalteromonas]|jgi:predicted amidohydrolase YtcJ|uniref:amidohydrolase n=1 Tax=Pseudoalteromonas TaxID=53246 RepID=UPI0003FD2495|nr:MULTISPECIES: amidohydrolase [Pseudoalteromonas]MAY60399.1 amidohydrolase [Pseudoalteromonas sp.]MDN3405890.1 amidohydrolase family protein [Pseudoalteromonas sp. APC 3218]MDN3408684.1 amidohydrolase family protein [Pseudoalteromonas sp. APC 3894]MDN3416089.1 amidohydrolase family protein [Pseudoalteromonas sp. APC 3227]MDN3419787.1 amidohydrolase family protein [Pseudoalteromonas sp. APC 3895]|tara:strand:- start:8361 stop:10049 length:1689 start_codon:yes stop_codon:yes gene_type:complete
MRLNKLIKPVLLASLCALSSVAIAQTKVIYNANGYTPLYKGKMRHGEVNTFTTLVIKDGKVVKTGPDSLKNSFPGATLIDANGKTLLPGLIDAHGHVIGLGENLSQLDVRGAKSVDEITAKLNEFAKGKEGWIIGRGWNQELWSDTRFPTAADLDKVVSDRPVILSRVDSHAIWVNSKALELANINADTPAPAGGEIIKDEFGKPTGIFIDKAETLVTQHMPATSAQSVSNALDAAGKHLLSLGITSTHDAGIDKTTWQVYKQRAELGTLPLRIVAMLSAASPDLNMMLKAGRYQDAQDFLSIRSVKIYADGALGSRGAALIEEYADRANHFGLMLETQQKLEQVFTLTFKSGFSANTHAIGDRANKIVLDAYQNVFKQTGGILLRNRMEHAQIVSPEDIPRFKTLKIIPSMQPVHATSDMHMAEQRLTDKQLKGAYAWQTFLEQGSTIAAGSDYPVELANPFDGLYSAITRMDHNQLPENGWRASEVLSREDALRAFTLGGAYAAHQEFKLGSLEQGKWADFILVDQDYFKVPIEQLYKTQVLQTWIAGTLRYEKDAAKAE